MNDYLFDMDLFVFIVRLWTWPGLIILSNPSSIVIISSIGSISLLWVGSYFGILL